jgi:hypothetical protein
VAIVQCIVLDAKGAFDFVDAEMEHRTKGFSASQVQEAFSESVAAFERSGFLVEGLQSFNIGLSHGVQDVESIAVDFVLFEFFEESSRKRVERVSLGLDSSGSEDGLQGFFWLLINNSSSSARASLAGREEIIIMTFHGLSGVTKLLGRCLL